MTNGNFSMSEIVSLIAGVGVMVLVLIFVGVLGGQAYEMQEDEILQIGMILNASGDGWNQSTSNSTIRDHIVNAVGSSFEAQQTVGDYMPIIVLAVIIFIVLGLVLSMGGLNTGRTKGGGAL